MARGIYRHFKELPGGDVWWARVEVSAGQWLDVEQADYEREGHQPAFWDLPLDADHFENAIRDPLIETQYQFERDVMQPSIMAMMGVGAVLFLVIVVGGVVLFKLGAFN